jgi:hypothetical protein
VRRWGWENGVFRVATDVGLLHALDDAFLGRQPGVDLRQHALVVSLIVGIGAIVAFPRLRPGARAGVSLVFGVLAIVSGSLHVRYVRLDGAEASDWTGVLAVVAGVVLAALGLAIPFVHRGEGAATRGRRWAYRAVAVVAAVVVAYAIAFPLSAAIVVTHKFREPIGEPPSAAYRAVTSDPRTGSSSPAGTRRRATALPSSSCTEAEATAAAQSSTRRCSLGTGTEYSCTTLAAAARAKGAQWPSAGAGRRTWQARSRSSGSAPMSIGSASAGSGCPRAPTS